ncbi:MAG: LON peptidase substrate-binding domain-containing protein [Bacteroidota bacterium]
MNTRRIRNLPLFPLKVVLFPGSLLPLHIFEERYKTLINECIGNQSEFGINLIEDDKIEPAGCSAIVKKVIREYDDGQMDIAVEGRSRYTLEHLVDSDSPYFVGQVLFFDDRAEKVNYSLRRRAIELYNRFVETAFKGTVIPANEASSDIKISFLLVQKAGLELKERQKFLALQSENERLSTLNRHFESMLPLLTSRDTHERFVMNDGYLAPSEDVS